MATNNISDLIASKKNCPICGTKSSFLPLDIGVNLYRCPTCDHCFTNVSALEEMEQYEGDYYDDKHSNWFENPNFKLFEEISKTFNELKPNAKVLDVGCGKLDLLRYLRPRHSGFDLSGIDFTTNEDVPNINFSTGDMFDLNEEKKFDAIVSLAVIEHVEDVVAFVGKFHRLINSGGIVVLMTVDDSSLLYSLSRLFARFGFNSAAERLYERHHINHFNQKSLRYLMESNGFNIDRV